MQAAQQPQEAQGSNKSPDEGKKSSKGESFLKGTFILTIAGFVVKVIGSLNWIFVSRILGGEGIGLYQMAFPIYFFAMTVSQAGVPVAISIITAERVALKDIYGAKRVFRISMGLMLVTGLLFSVLTYFAADWLIEWHFIRDARAYLSMVVLAPTVFFVTLLAASRGYLQGWQRMTPTAVSHRGADLPRHHDDPLGAALPALGPRVRVGRCFARRLCRCGHGPHRARLLPLEARPRHRARLRP